MIARLRPPGLRWAARRRPVGSLVISRAFVFNRRDMPRPQPVAELSGGTPDARAGRAGEAGSQGLGRADGKGSQRGRNVVDADGFRPNVGIVLANQCGQVLWARRVGGHDAWQFPQGGINDGESPDDALYRELHEEVGLAPECVRVIARTRGWLRYRLPRRLRRHNSTPGFRGQKQKWYLLEMLAADSTVCVDGAHKPEFDDWRWVSYWYPLGQVVDFKRDVYRRMLKELAMRLPVARAPQNDEARPHPAVVERAANPGPEQC